MSGLPIQSTAPHDHTGRSLPCTQHELRIKLENDACRPPLYSQNKRTKLAPNLNPFSRRVSRTHMLTLSTRHVSEICKIVSPRYSSQSNQHGSRLVGVPSVNSQPWRFTNNILGFPPRPFLVCFPVSVTLCRTCMFFSLPVYLVVLRALRNLLFGFVFMTTSLFSFCFPANSIHNFGMVPLNHVYAFHYPPLPYSCSFIPILI